MFTKEWLKYLNIKHLIQVIMKLQQVNQNFWMFFFPGWIATVIQNDKKDNPNKLIIAKKIKMTDQIDMISSKILLYFGLYHNHLRRWST